MTARSAILALILLTVALNAAAQLLLRAAMRSGVPAHGSMLALALDIGLRPGIIAGILCYGLSVVMWIYVLSKTEVSFAYPFLGAGFIVVALAAWLVLGEPLTSRKIIGTVVIACGVVILAGR